MPQFECILGAAITEIRTYIGAIGRPNLPPDVLTPTPLLTLWI
jgi:hypothetical protein